MNLAPRNKTGFVLSRHCATLVCFLSLVYSPAALALPHLDRNRTAGATVRGTVGTSNNIVPPDTKVFVLDSATNRMVLRKIVSDDGRYRIDELPPGKYIFKAVAGKTYRADEKRKQISEGEDNVINFFLEWSTSRAVIEGHITDEYGQVLVNTKVYLTLPDCKECVVAEALTDGQGKYEISDVATLQTYQMAVGRKLANSDTAAEDVIVAVDTVYVRQEQSRISLLLQLDDKSGLVATVDQRRDPLGAIPNIPLATSNTPPATAATSEPTVTASEQDIFNRGRALFAKGRYEQAATVFRDFLKGHPDSFIADLMLLWLGRSYIELGKYQEADQVAKRLRTIKDTPFVDIYESELTAAKRDIGQAASAATGELINPAARPTPTPARTAAASTPATSITESSGTQSTSSRPKSARASEAGDSSKRQGGKGRRSAASQPAGRVASAPSPSPSTAASTGVRNPSGVSSSSPPEPSYTRPRVVSSEQPTPAATSTSAAVNTQASPGEGQSGFSITVTQVPDLQLALRRTALAAQPGQVIQLPLVITNSGNKEDQFRLETDLPAEYQPSFSQSGNDTSMPVFVTPTMQRGASIEVTLNARVPESAPDNQQQRFLVRAASQSDALVTKVSDASLTVVAAALAAASNALQENVQPGETFTQRISVRNQGSATARQTRADFVFNPDFELVSASPAPISYDRPSRTAIWSLGDLESRDNREITVTLRAVSEALAGANKPVGRGTMRTQSLFIPSNFDGPAISVGRVAGARVDAVSKGLTATPGDTIYIPFMVRNPSNYSESFELRIVAPGAPQATVYADTNGDGRHQDAEPAVTQTAALDPRGGQYPVLLGVQIPRTPADRTQFAYNLVTRAMNAGGRIAGEDSTVLTVATPRVRVRAELPNTEVKPGDTIFYRLVLVNDGGGLARGLNLTEVLPDALEFISSSPELTMQDLGGGNRGLVWRVAELAPGDTQVLQVTVRPKQGIPANAVITPRHTLTYQDLNANNYIFQ
jgi:uncharacterized repeat protein (TIGR01451 family)